MNYEGGRGVLAEREKASTRKWGGAGTGGCRGGLCEHQRPSVRPILWMVDKVQYLEASELVLGRFNLLY